MLSGSVARALFRRAQNSLITSCKRSYSHSSAGGGHNWKRWCQTVYSNSFKPAVATTVSLSFLSKGEERTTASRSLGAQALPPSVPIELSRMMLPDDTNPSGNVHGGTILKMVEQAGNIVATRYCNKGGRKDPVITVLVRADHIDFLEPMYVGEVAQLQAAVTYTSPRSMEVTVDVWAENVLTGARRHTNTATLWYVAVPMDVNVGLPPGGLNAIPVPPLESLSAEQREKGLQRYKKQKAERHAMNEKGNDTRMTPSYHTQSDYEPHTVFASQSTLANVVLPSDCIANHLMGGMLMKMMDSAAGMCAIRHCRTNVVTACIDAINFHEPIMNGEVVFVTARPVFTSNRSIEIEICCEAEGPKIGSRRVASTAYFTFVSIGKDRRAQPVPPLILKTDDEKKRYEEGLKRYNLRREQRK